MGDISAYLDAFDEGAMERKAAQDLESLSGLFSHPGWKLIETYLEGQEKVTYMDILKATDPVLLGRAVGSHDAIKKVRAWPQVQIQTLQKYVRSR